MRMARKNQRVLWFSARSEESESYVRDKDGNILDVYTLDPDTRIGTDSNGETVNLPQTGNNSLDTLLWGIAALILMVAGLFAVKASGVTFRKRKMDE